MDQRAASRLRILGLVVVVLFFMFAIPVHKAVAVNGEAYQDALAATLAFGIALLLLAEIGPIVKSIKAGGVELQFKETLDTRFAELEKRIMDLELAASKPESTIQQVKEMASENPKPPALIVPERMKKRRRDDQWKGRFGGLSKNQGYELTADFRKAGSDTVDILLKVIAPEGEVSDLERVDFYLHQSFDPDIMPAAFENGVAQLSRWAWGGFTVGAWIPSKGVELELDLAELPNAPRIIREL
jgi:hypothetical protein